MTNQATWTTLTLAITLTQANQTTRISFFLFYVFHFFFFSSFRDTRFRQKTVLLFILFLSFFLPSFISFLSIPFFFFPSFSFFFYLSLFFLLFPFSRGIVSRLPLPFQLVALAALRIFSAPDTTFLLPNTNHPTSRHRHQPSYRDSASANNTTTYLLLPTPTAKSSSCHYF